MTGTTDKTAAVDDARKWSVGETFTSEDFTSGVAEIVDGSGYVVAYVPLHMGSSRNDERKHWPKRIADAEAKLSEQRTTIERLERERDAVGNTYDLLREAAAKSAQKAESRVAELEAQLRQEREATEYSNRVRLEAEDMATGYADALKSARAQVAQLQTRLESTNGPWEVKPLRDYQWAICAPDGEVLCVSNKESFTRQVAQLQTTISTLTAALARVEAWDLPTTGRKWDDGTPVSYGAAYGSNGERDYVRSIARTALANITQKPEEKTKP